MLNECLNGWLPETDRNRSIHSYTETKICRATERQTEIQNERERGIYLQRHKQTARHGRKETERHTQREKSKDR